MDKYKSEHFEWFVHFQLEEKAYEESYEQYKTDCNLGSAKTVIKAVKESVVCPAQQRHHRAGVENWRNHTKLPPRTPMHAQRLAAKQHSF